MKRLWLRIREVWPWVLTLAILLFVFIRPSLTLSASLKLGACAFQILSIFALLYLIEEKGRQANVPDIWQMAATWLKGLLAKRYDIQAESGAFGISGSDIRMELWRKPQGSSVEDRFAAMEKNVQTLREQLSLTAKELEVEKLERRREIQAEHEAREGGLAMLEEALRQYAVGSFHLEVAAALWQVIALALTFAEIIVD